MTKEKICQRCMRLQPIANKNLYCVSCKEIVIDELKSVGYLTRIPPSGYRSKDAMEDIRETKFGL